MLHISTLHTPENGQTLSNNSSAAADELLECVWPFCGLALKGLNNALKLRKITCIMILWFIILDNSVVVVVFTTNRAKYPRMDQVKFMKDSL